VVDHSREVVCQAREAEFSANVREPLHEARALIIGVFDRATGVFHELLSLLQDLRGGCEPLLHALEDVRINPAGHPSPIVVAGARLLERTSLACTRGSVVDMAAQLSGLTSKGPRLSPRTAVAVLVWGIGEALFSTEAQLGVG
jgi:hypothetical protein